MYVYGTKKLSFNEMTKLLSFQKVKYEKSVDSIEKEDLIELKESLEYTIKYLDEKTILSEKEEMLKTDLKNFKQQLDNANSESEGLKVVEDLKEYFNKINNNN